MKNKKTNQFFYLKKKEKRGNKNKNGKKEIYLTKQCC
jgi:hypothetical protein